MKNLCCGFLLLLAALIAGGCRVRPEQRAILTQYEHDLRRYEDLVYDLEYEYEILCSENDRLKEKLGELESGSKRSSPRLFRPQNSSPPTNAPKSKKEEHPEDELAPPEIETGPMTPAVPMKLTPEVPRSPHKESLTPAENPAVPMLEENKPEPLKSEPKKSIQAQPWSPKATVPSDPKPSNAKPPVEQPRLSLPQFETVGEEPPTTAEPPPRRTPADLPPMKPQVEDAPPSAVLAPKVTPPRNEEPLPPPAASNPRFNLAPPKAAVEPESLDALPAPKADRPTSAPRIPELLPEPTDKKVSQIRIDNQQTRELDTNRQAGSDALRVVLIPQNAQGETVPVAGKISVVLLDPNQQGEAARVGRWDFDASFVRYQNHLARRQHLTLDLPWQNGVPTSTNLMLFVRYEAQDSSLVEAKDVIALNTLPDAQQQQAWTPRTAHRKAAVAQHVPAESSSRDNIAPAAHTEPVESPAEQAPPKKASLTKPEWKPYR
jgi:hypothetical protein